MNFILIIICEDFYSTTCVSKMVTIAIYLLDIAFWFVPSGILKVYEHVSRYSCFIYFSTYHI